MTILWKAVEQCFTVLLLVFQFYPVCKFGKICQFGLGAHGSERVLIITLFIEGKCLTVWTLTNLLPSPRSNWNLEVLVFVEGGKPENPEKNPRSKEGHKPPKLNLCDSQQETLYKQDRIIYSSLY